ncbi:MAG: L7Ae/L30e/S12e/Gadd45 family ribosomal protein [Peptococcaceae bacterium]
MNKAILYTSIGFAQKSGKLVSGESGVKALLNKNQIFLLIAAEDLSDNRKRFWNAVAQQAGIPIIIQGNKRELGIAIGMSPRALIGITDKKMAVSIENKLQ